MLKTWSFSKEEIIISDRKQTASMSRGGLHASSWNLVLSSLPQANTLECKVWPRIRRFFSKPSPFRWSLCLIPAVLNTDRPRCCTTTPGDASHHRQVASSNLELACTLEFQVCKSPNLGFYISQNLPRCKPPTCSRRLHQQATFKLLDWIWNCVDCST